MIYKLTISSVFDSNDFNVVYNWLMEVYGFKSALRLEQVALWLVSRDTVVYTSRDKEHIDSFCYELEMLDLEYTLTTFEHEI